MRSTCNRTHSRAPQRTLEDRGECLRREVPEDVPPVSEEVVCYNVRPWTGHGGELLPQLHILKRTRHGLGEYGRCAPERDALNDRQTHRVYR
jgi:hypothetical protein